MNRVVDFRWLLKLGIAVAILAWLLSRADVGTIFKLLSHLSPGIVLVLSAMYLLGIFVGTLKWWVLLPEQKLTVLFRLNLMAQFYALIIPGQLGGEAIKAYLLGKGRRDAERVAASVVLDKATGVIALLVFGVVGAALTALPLGMSARASFVGALAASIALLACLRLPVVDRTVRATLGRAQRRLQRAQRLLAQIGVFLDAWRAYLARPSMLVLSTAVGILYHGIYMAMIVLLARLFGFQLPIYEWCWIFALVSLSVIVPVTLAGLGVREGAFVGLLAAFGVGVEAALAVSLTLFFFQLLMGGIGALVHLSWKGADSKNAARQWHTD